MKVLHVTSNLDPRRGGPVSALLGLAHAQAEIGLEVTIVINSAQHSVERGELENSGVRFIDLTPPLSLLRPSKTSLQVLAAEIRRADIIHIHGLWEEPQHSAAVLARKYNKPYLIRPCGMLDPWCFNQKRAKKQLYYWWKQKADLNGAAALHFTSEMERQGTSFLRLKTPTIIEPNGVALEKFASLPSTEIFSQQYPLVNGRRTITFVGRIYPIKGLDLLIPAFAKAQIENTVLCVLGPDEDNYQATVQQLAQQCGVADKVLFTGILSGELLRSALAQADLFVLSSYHENFGNAVIEALACGTPVIVSDQVGLSHEIHQAKVGAVVPLSADALAREISRWMNDNELREAAAQRARPFVWERYNWNEIAARWKAHYQQLLI